jgi:hypothetical protein
VDRILSDLAAVEPLLRKAADHEIRATIPLTDVAAEVLHMADISPEPGIRRLRALPSAALASAQHPAWGSDGC